jgi:hypothetical protein
VQIVSKKKRKRKKIVRNKGPGNLHYVLPVTLNGRKKKKQDGAE